MPLIKGAAEKRNEVRSKQAVLLRTTNLYEEDKSCTQDVSFICLVLNFKSIICIPSSAKKSINCQEEKISRPFV